VTAAVFWLTGVAAAQSAGPVVIEVMVSQISQQPGSIDPRAKRLDAKLRDEFRYESLQVLSQRKLTLKLNELATVALPDGNELQLRPLNISDHGVLVAVTVKGSVQSDLQIPNGHLVAIGAGRHGDGKLVISLEPTF
jgi:hypothetical protein